MDGIIATSYTYPDTSKRNADIRWEAVEVETKDYDSANSIVNNFTTAVQNGDSFTHFKGKVVFPFSGTVTFMVYGDDKSMLKIGDKVCYLNKYLENYNSAIQEQTNKITIDVKANTPIKLDAYCLNGGGNGKMYLKYCVDGSNFSDIPSSYCYNYFADDSVILANLDKQVNIYKNQYDLSKNNINQFYKNEVNLSSQIYNIICLDDNGQEVIPNADTTVKNMYDGNYSTYFHTAWKGEITPFPHNYFIEFKEEITFNKIKFYFDSRGEKYAFGDYEIYSSLDGANYTKIASGKNDKKNFDQSFASDITAKFVKLVVKNNSQSTNFTSIAEIEFYINSRLEDYNFATSANQNLTYLGNWQHTTGKYINSQATYSKNGKVQFYFTGTNLTIYSYNKNAAIKIDGKNYTILDNSNLYSPSFVINNLSDEKHLVEISGEELYLDAIKTNGEISSAKQKYLSQVISKQQILIFTPIILVGLTAILIVPYAYSKHKKSKSR